MFDFFNNRSDIENARRELRKLNKRRDKLLRLINGHVITSDDILDGVVVLDRDNNSYTVKISGLGLYNLYTNTGLYTSQVLSKAVTKSELIDKLNEFNFKMAE